MVDKIVARSWHEGKAAQYDVGKVSHTDQVRKESTTSDGVTRRKAAADRLGTSYLGVVYNSL